ncbi:MAG: hypothetical protein IKQ90_02930 [Ruminococcus sp.]|nr:hypothetical protein [Ruminococcus sp.]
MDNESYTVTFADDKASVTVHIPVRSGDEQERYEKLIADALLEFFRKIRLS